MLTLNDCTKVQSKIRIVYPCLSSLISLAARKSLRKPTLMKFSCRGQRKLHLTPQNADFLLRAKTELRTCSVSALHATRRGISILSTCCVSLSSAMHERSCGVNLILSRDVKMRAAINPRWNLRKSFLRIQNYRPKKSRINCNKSYQELLIISILFIVEVNRIYFFNKQLIVFLLYFSRLSLAVFSFFFFFYWKSFLSLYKFNFYIKYKWTSCKLIHWWNLHY